MKSLKINVAENENSSRLNDYYHIIRPTGSIEVFNWYANA